MPHVHSAVMADHQSPRPRRFDSIRPIISLHLIDTGLQRSVRRKLPNISEVAGLRSVRKVLGAPLGGSDVLAAQPTRGGFIAFWDDLEALDDFDDWHPAAREFRNGWRARAEPLDATGSWPGLSVEVPAEDAITHRGPVLGLTIGNVRLAKVGGLQKRNASIENPALASPSFVWGATLAGPTRLLATVSMWNCAEGLDQFARSRPTDLHDAAHSARSDAPLFTESAFIRCRILSTAGGLHGRNPVPQFAVA